MMVSAVDFMVEPNFCGLEGENVCVLMSLVSVINDVDVFSCGY